MPRDTPTALRRNSRPSRLPPRPVSIEDLISRYGEGALLTVRPYMPDGTGEVLRWEAQIDGQYLSDADVALREAPNSGPVRMLLVFDEDEIEVARWTAGKHPAAVIRRLRELRYLAVIGTRRWRLSAKLT